VFNHFCSAYGQRLILAGRGDSKFTPLKWWGRPDHEGDWLQAARFLAARPEPWPEFVAWLFKPGVDGRIAKLPEPSFLSDPKWWYEFEREYATANFQQTLKSRLAGELHVQRSQLQISLQETIDSHELGLNLDDGTPNGMLRRAIRIADISPLFACCIALEAGLIDAAHSFRDAAWDQYWPYARFFDEIWGGLIPPHLKAEYERVSRQRKGAN
jgi:hypothetical protein